MITPSQPTPLHAVELFDKEAKKEIADVQIYLDILAFQLGIDMGEAVTEKYNEVSDRIGVSIYIGDDDDYHYKS